MRVEKRNHHSGKSSCPSSLGLEPSLTAKRSFSAAPDKKSRPARPQKFLSISPNSEACPVKRKGEPPTRKESLWHVKLQRREIRPSIRSNWLRESCSRKGRPLAEEEILFRCWGGGGKKAGAFEEHCVEEKGEGSFPCGHGSWKPRNRGRERADHLADELRS